MAGREQAVTHVEPESSSAFELLVGVLRLIFDLVMLAVVMLVIGFFIFTGSIERSQLEPRTADGIAVLTGGAARIDEAMKLLTQQKAKRLLITGVNRTTSTEELKQLASQGDQLFSCCVDIDKEARNTIDNATETSQWVARNHYTSVIVVTSNYHMPRALAELARVMPGVTLIPYSVVDNNVHLDRWWTFPGTTRLLISEYLKYLPALARLGATQLVSKLITGKTTVAVEDPTEP
jgi:uncharacterized SAM-binding protein YcdF (DUF218 family)